MPTDGFIDLGPHSVPSGPNIDLPLPDSGGLGLPTGISF